MHRIQIRSFLAIFFALLFTFPNLSATTYYVSPAGDDLDAGTIGSPFATIQHGSNQLLSGDSLVARGGTYFEKIYLNVSGSVTDPITIAAHVGEVPIVDGTGVTGLELLTIHEQSYVTIDGLIFQNNYVQYAKGIFISSEGQGITLQNCTVRNVGWTSDATADPYGVTPTGQAHGILVNGRTTNGIQDIEVSQCQIYDLVTGNSEALTLVGNVSDFIIEEVTVYQTTNIGIVVAGHYGYAVDDEVSASLNQCRNGRISDCVVYDNRRIDNVDAPAGIYADGASNVLIVNNVSFRNGNGLSVGCENAGFSADSIIVAHNLVYDNDNQGIIFGSNADTIFTCTLQNNTFLHNGSLGAFYSEVSVQNSRDCLIAQNILLPRSSSHYGVSIFGYITTNLLVDNNLVYRYDGSMANLYVPGTPAQFAATNTTIADPLLIDTALANPNVRLQTGSPAIDLGLLSYGILDPVDVYGNARLINGALDLGASENENGGCPQLLTINSGMILAGYFTASDSIQVEVQSAAISDSMHLSAPHVEILPTFESNEILLIEVDGCN